MGRRTVDTTRRMTRNGLRAHLQQQFAQLPLEIVCAIVTIAARDNISAGNRRWVAQSLAIVCKLFCDAAEPVLVESVWIWRHTNFDNVRPGRFTRTKHLYVASPLVVWSPEEFPSLEALTGRPFDVERIQRARYALPPRLTLHFYAESWDFAGGPPWIETLNGVTHLRINDYSAYECPLELLPASVTHLVLALSRRPNSNTPWGDEYTVKLEDQVTRILASSRLHLARVLISLNDMQPGDAIRILAHMRQTFDASSCDARLWVDESSTQGLSAGEKELLDPAQTEIWYAGRPLHSQSSPSP
ncbi:hypothetical protein EXIGLDRAFT_774726 [Exidia glandulosa HHB12029]|uniref:F-box domain-containing protein n=1 Tax=Exidia glandulosa HHB12029 TaxID=1314781 RepID=A0A165E8P2_EXIGL|nr:hypothetical protein EXIGLDRAFT_774726 [Exidia glandulosa HHB12029]